MVRKALSAILLCALLVSAVACAGVHGDPDVTEEHTTAEETTTEAVTTAPESDMRKDGEILDASKEYNILFIGNSYTFYNEMPEKIFAPLAEAAGYKVNVKSITEPSWTLYGFADPEDNVGKLFYADLAENKYDFVIIQEQSTQAIKDVGQFYDGARTVVEKVRENGAVPLFYCTWGRKTGHFILDDNGLTTETMMLTVAGAYEAIGRELGVAVAYVGHAFYDMFTQDLRGGNVYHNDLSHPSYMGSYLAAMTIFGQLTGVDPTTVDYTEGCPKALVDPLRAAARKAVFEEILIPDEYKTVSEGIHKKP